MPIPWAPPTTAPGTNFAIFSEVAERVELCLFSERGKETRVRAHRGRRVRLARLPAGRRARSALRLPGARALRPGAGPALQPGTSCSSTRTPRPWTARCVWDEAVFGYPFGDPDGRNDADSAPFVPKSVVVNPFFDWGSDRAPRIPYHETVIYEAHVRGPDDRAPGDPRGAARHLHRPRAPGDDRAPQAARRHRGRADAGARVPQRPPPAGEGPVQLLGLQHHRLPGPAPRLRDAPAAGPATRCRSSRRWSATCTTRASR